MKKIKLIAALLFGATAVLMAQSSSLKKADRYYEARSYAMAIPHYEKALKKDSANPAVLANLADCYRLTNNSRGELRTYGKLVQQGKASDIQKLYYAEALTSEGRFTEAKPIFDQYTADARGKEKASSANKVKSYSKNADAYAVSKSNYNSAQSDFGAIEHNGSVYYLSSRFRSQWFNYKQGWTNEAPVRLYKASGNDSCGKRVHASSFNLNEGPLTFAGNNSVYLTRNEQKKNELNKLKIYKAVIRDEKLDSVSMLSFCNDNFNYVHPATGNGGSVLYFSSDREGGYGGYDLYSAMLQADGSWSQITNLGDKVNTAGNEVFPYMSSNGLLYFSSNGHDGLGGLDVYETRIKEGKAGRIYNMGLPINSAHDDFAYYPANDNKTAFLSSNRDKGGLDDDIYRVNILREVKRGKDVNVIVADKANGNVLPGVTLYVNSDSVLTDDKGSYSTMVEEDNMLRIRTRHADYFSGMDSITTSSSNEDVISRNINLEKDPKLALVATVKDLKTGQPLEGAKVTIRELPSNNVFDSYTSTSSAFRKPLRGKKIGDKISYEFSMEKEGYLPKRSVFIYDVTKPGDINVNESVDLSLGKVEVGMDIGKMIDLKPIYFDLGKSTIRKDAAVELDKIVAIMKEYPNMSIELGSHTDCRSGAASNMKLSGARAKSSAAYIVKKGIDKTRIVGKGYGETKLLNGCACEGKVKSTCSEEEHAKNRRTEFIITKLGSK